MSEWGNWYIAGVDNNAILRAIVNQLKNNPGKYITVKTCRHVEPNISSREVDLYVSKLKEDGYISNIEPFGDGCRAELTLKGKDIRDDHYFTFDLNSEPKNESTIVNITHIEGDNIQDSSFRDFKPIRNPHKADNTKPTSVIKSLLSSTITKTVIGGMILWLLIQFVLIPLLG